LQKKKKVQMQKENEYVLHVMFGSLQHKHVMFGSL